MKLKPTDDLVMKRINLVTKFLIFLNLALWGAGMGVQATESNVMAVNPEKVQVKENPNWPRPTILPLPVATAGIEKPVISLNGIWQINTNAPEEYWKNTSEPGSWQDIRVPATASSQGIRATKLSAMRKKVLIPSDYAGNRIFLRLDGVSGESKLYVNGKYIRDHNGAYTAWSADITDAVAPGQEAWIMIGFESSGNGRGSGADGISRNVNMVAVPVDYLYRFNVETDLDGEYRDATLKVWLGMDFHSGKDKQVKFILKDPKTQATILVTSPIKISKDDPEFIVEVPVSNPLKWDDEHPNLYHLEAQILDGNKVICTLVKKIGFREIEKKGRNILVNGKVVKVHGVNRHDIHPIKGRAVSEEDCWNDARILRDGNINVVRTSHYPTMEAFLDACDAMGIYIDSETNLAFEMDLQNNPEYRSRYLDQWSEMIERDRSHPCILMWSMGNETAWGRHVNDQLTYVKQEDKSRPIIFSWSNMAPLSPQQTSRFPNIKLERPFDIHSLHYAYYDSNLGDMSEFWTGTSYINGWGKNFSREGIDMVQEGMPIMHDESTHISCYNLEEMARDPNVRNFWGETIKQFWDSIYYKDGALGMCIWAGIDNYTIVPGMNSKRVHAWGILDGWRREKPEYWLAKKAFSPVRIDNKPITGVREGSRLEIPIKNWFSHTNMKEVEVEWQIGTASGKISGPDLEPGGAKGMLLIPAVGWSNGDVLQLRFYRLKDILVDEFRIPVNPDEPKVSIPSGTTPQISESDHQITIAGHDFELVFSKETGLITEGKYKGTILIKSGPYLHLQGIKLPGWSLGGIKYRTESPEAVVTIMGKYGEARVTFEIRIDGNGLMKTSYKLDYMPYIPPVPDVALTHAMSPSVGGYEEVGVSFVLSNDVDRLSWKRNGLWSFYPEDHIGRNEGTAYRTGRGSNQPFAVQPTIPWSEDERNYELFGMYDIGQRGTNDFRSMKENIYNATAGISGTGKGICAESVGRDAIRLQLMDDPNTMVDDRDARISYEGKWMRYEDDHRDYLGTLSTSNRAGDAVAFSFEGTGVAWIGSRDIYHGNADVFIDGKLKVDGLNTVSGANWDHPSGQDKEPRVTLYSIEGLQLGRHTLKIVVRGDEDRDNIKEGFISVDAFKALGTDSKADVKMIIANEWNYPEVGWIRWGNYTKNSIVVGTGYENNILMKFSEIR